MVATRQVALGRWGEQVAAGFLADQGLVVVDRNWRCRYGEIDLVALDPRDRAVVVVEVKTRRSTAYGGPLAAIDPRKAARLRRLAGLWLAQHPQGLPTVRIDVIAVWWRADRTPLVQHVSDIG